MKVRGIRKKQINKKFNQAIAGQPVFPAQMEDGNLINILHLLFLWEDIILNVKAEV